MMKKFTAIMMALIMVLTLTQCKPDKGNEGDTQNGSKVKVSCVIPMNKNTRSEFTNLMTDGSIKWSAGTERIYLAIPNETNPQIVEMTAFTTVESNILLFEGEVEAGLLTAGEYEVWYLGNSKESGNSYITETKEGDIIKSISGSIANQSGDLDDLGYCHVAMTTVTAETEGEEVVLSLNGTLKNKIAIAHLDLEGITQLKGDAIVGTEYALQYNNGAFEFAVTPDAKANIAITEGTNASYVILFPNSTANVDLKSNTSKKVTFEGGVEANKIYYKHVSDMEYYPLAWEDYEEETNTINGHEYVDLGLPSGLLWATCNVGANSPEAYGDYFAWGETETKSEYTEENSVTYGRQMNDISGNAQFDAATANWGDGWRMPTKAEMQELLEKCTFEWTAENGVYGQNVTGPNGNSIFLPASGECLGESFSNCGYSTYSWISTPCDGNSNASEKLICHYNVHYAIGLSMRYDGITIRPVSGGNFTEPVAQYAFVETSEVKEITSSSAVCGGNVTTDNGSTVTAKGVCWSTNKNPTIDDNKTTDGSGVGSFTSNLSNLEPNTIYYVRAYATNAAGTSYGETISFTTLAQTNTINGHEYVDLGLPSGLLWATCNVGANSPEEYGDYFAWGETEAKETYTSSVTLKFSYLELQSQGYIDEDGKLTPSHDAATANWGSSWRMPTFDELQELITSCTWTWTTQNGVNGYKLTSKTNGNTIFLPAAGCYRRGYKEGTRDYGHYWSSEPLGGNTTHAYEGWFYSSGLNVIQSSRSCGLPVRSVSGGNFEDSEEEETPSGEINGHEYVDLGLPSGLKWATCNIGAEMPEEYGDYYSWGEINEYDKYLHPNIPTGKLSYSELQSQGYIDENGNLTPSHDAATANWGNLWRMPTKDEMQELLSNCNWKFTTQNNVNGFKVTGPNGKHIFLPAAGTLSGSSIFNGGSNGKYWSSTPYSDSNSTYILYFYDNGDGYSRYINGTSRGYGLSIRPVID